MPVRLKVHVSLYSDDGEFLEDWVLFGEQPEDVLLPTKEERDSWLVDAIYRDTDSLEECLAELAPTALDKIGLAMDIALGRRPNGSYHISKAAVE